MNSGPGRKHAHDRLLVYGGEAHRARVESTAQDPLTVGVG